MTRKIINVGVADKGNGDPIRVAFSKANDNFAELYNILSNNTGGSIITTDVIGSVFADDSTLLVDGINGSIPYSVLSGAPTIPAAQVQSNWTATNGMGVILNKPTLFSGSYTDLTNKPTAFSFSVAADDSTQRAISSNESIKFIGSGGITTASDAEGNITINYVQGDIRSEGNIDIEINLSDSTLRRWQFGEDGNLTLPAGGNISEGGGLTGAIRLTPAGGANANQALLIYPTAAAEGDHIHLTAGGGSTELYLGDDLHFVKLTSDGFVVIKAYDGVNGAVWGFSPDGTTSIPGNIKSDSNINIDINLSDSTLRRWQFGEDGDTVFPNNVSINYSGGNIQYPRIIADSGKAFSVQGQGTSGSAALSWTVNPDAAGQYAAVAVSKGGGDNLAKVILQAQSDSGDAGTAKIWKFDETGSLTFPDTTVQTTAYTGLTPNGTKASTATGTAGQTSFDSNYFYVCIATNTWRRVELGSSY